MSEKQVRTGCVLALAAYIVLVLAFYWVSGEQLHFRDEETDAISAGEPIGELVHGGPPAVYRRGG